MNVTANLCFTGHRPEPFGGEDSPLAVAVKSALVRAVEDAYESGFRRFITGMAHGVDTWAREAVIELRKAHPDVMLIAAVPSLVQTVGWSQEAVARWQGILGRSAQVWNCEKNERVTPGALIDDDGSCRGTDNNEARPEL